jgi:hypothetical protein
MVPTLMSISIDHRRSGKQSSVALLKGDQAV